MYNLKTILLKSLNDYNNNNNNKKPGGVALVPSVFGEIRGERIRCYII